MSQIKNEINIAAVLDVYAYLDSQRRNLCEDNPALSHIIELIHNDPTFYAENEVYYQAIVDAIAANPELGEYTLISQSAQDGEISPDLLYAVTFKAPDGTIYVCYRGTGDGKWVDNGVGMYQTSQMQIEAGRYFDKVVNMQGLTESDRIIVTGHSKGGNSAQYATLGSYNARLVDACYSIDGEGFSESTIEFFKQNLGLDYDNQIKKMYSINGQNDYVHDLGIPVIDSNRTYFVSTTDDSGLINKIKSYHMLTNMLYNGKLDYDNADGIIVNYDPFDSPNEDYAVKQGKVGVFAKKVSENMFELDKEELQDSAMSVMSLLELIMNEDGKYVGTGDNVVANPEQYLAFYLTGIPVIRNAFFDTFDLGLIGDIIGLQKDNENKLYEGISDIISENVYNIFQIAVNATTDNNVYFFEGTPENDEMDFSTGDLEVAGIKIHVGGSYELKGGAGNDHIIGYDNDDYLCGDDGDDIISGRDGDDEIYGGNGNDIVMGGAGNDEIDGGDGDDKLFGNEGNDEIIGGFGTDRMFGMNGDDWLYGGFKDPLLEDNSSDYIYGGTGSDHIYGGGGNDYLYGEDGDDIICGEDGDDIIFGGDNLDEIYGDAGNDYIDGGSGNDYIFGSILPDEDGKCKSLLLFNGNKYQKYQKITILNIHRIVNTTLIR